MMFVCSLLMTLTADPVPCNVVIRHGTIYDGTGKPAVVGDVAVMGDRIVAVGKFEVAGTPTEVDAKGLCVAPGFIDLHNHSDVPVLNKETRECLCYLRQGCTTMVTGNCGSGVVNVRAFFDKLDKAGAGTHIIHLMPHGAIRQEAMGAVNRAPGPDELKKMRALVDQGMRDGAFGMSTGLIYVPGSYAQTEELIELSQVVKEHGGIYASHIRTEGTGVLGAVEEALTIGRKASLPIHISHLKASGVKAWGMGNDICNLIQNAIDAGMKVTADQYPYAASSTSLSAIVLPTSEREGGLKELIKRLDQEETRQRVLKLIEKSLDSRGDGSRIVVANYSKNAQWNGKNLDQIGMLIGKTAVEAALEIIRNNDASVVNFGMSEEDVRLITARPFVATASDGSTRVPDKTVPHPRSYGTFTRKIGEYAHRRGWLTVEQAIRSSSGLPADILGLTDRGYVKVGAVADLVVFKLDDLKDHATFEDPHQFSTGFRLVMVAGQNAIVNDIPTLIRSGRPIRHASIKSGN